VTSLIHLIDPNTCQGNNVFWLVKCNRGVETRLWRILNHISSFLPLFCVLECVGTRTYF
jgi:hypothetical protein